MPASSTGEDLATLLAEVRACTRCAAHLPLGPRPVLRASTSARLLIVGQAPGTKVHESGIPWNDRSGARLRDWLGLTPEVVYDERRVAIVPMGFCYPGRDPRGGDRPPRPECAPLWHERLLAQMPQVACTILIGRYAMERYAADIDGTTLAERVRAVYERDDERVLLPHPSPRNQRWLRRHPWFVEEVLPELRGRIAEVLG